MPLFLKWNFSPRRQQHWLNDRWPDIERQWIKVGIHRYHKTLLKSPSEIVRFTSYNRRPSAKPNSPAGINSLPLKEVRRVSRPRDHDPRRRMEFLTMTGALTLNGRSRHDMNKKSGNQNRLRTAGTVWHYLPVTRTRQTDELGWINSPH